MLFVSNGALLSVNVWTGSPLFALWVGSQVQGDGPPTMGAIAVTAITLLAVSITLVQLLGRVSASLRFTYTLVTNAPVWTVNYFNGVDLAGTPLLAQQEPRSPLKLRSSSLCQGPWAQP